MPKSAGTGDFSAVLRPVFCVASSVVAAARSVRYRTVRRQLGARAYRRRGIMQMRECNCTRLVHGGAHKPQWYDARMHSYLQRLSAIGLAPASLALGLALSPARTMAIEEPGYEQLDQDGDFSLRRYAAVIVAETEIDGTLDHASSAGFRRLAGYIFGANHRSAGDSSNKDGPVAPQAKTKIAMTAPVTTYQHGAGWTVNFTMPAQYTLRSLPTPDDGRVKLREIPELTAAVIRFSGWVNESKIASETQLLRDWMAAHGLAADGDARLARYNPPWTLPFLRRNEILIPCRKAHR